MPGLKIISIEEIPSDCSEPVNAKVLEQTKAIVSEIRNRGEAAFVEFATKFGDIKEGEAYTYNKEELKAAFDSLPEDQKGVLTRVVRR
jgi:histidinol dehydrogenase